MKLYVWGSSGTFVEIVEVQDLYSLPGSSGDYTLEGDRVYLNSSLPAQRIEVNAVGNIVVETSDSTSFDFDLLESIGFSVSHGTKWYARYYYNFHINLGV